MIINTDNHIISTGYNGFPPGVSDSLDIWNSETKHEYVIHAEINALLHSTQTVRGGSLYTTFFPCRECTKAICSAGISKVFYKDAKYLTEISVNMFNRCNIKLFKVT